MKTFLKGALGGCVATVALLTTACSVEHNVLTPEEKSAGWELLFDGATLDGWKITTEKH